ncbi:MAG: hypothetical protein HKN85_03565, partial [Gammaproteobacteria bacterium]|nr:hypothetical protein [Gammaproteobacteria bacterium]
MTTTASIREERGMFIVTDSSGTEREFVPGHHRDVEWMVRAWFEDQIEQPQFWLDLADALAIIIDSRAEALELNRDLTETQQLLLAASQKHFDDEFKNQWKDHLR